MSNTSGPHAPEEGWQTRWIIQAAGLLIRSPITILSGIVMILIASVAGSIANSMASDVWGYAAVTPFLAPIGILVPVVISASLARSEGHGTVSMSDLKSGIITLMKLVFLIEAVIILAATALFVNDVSLAEGVELPTRSMQDQFLMNGTTSVISGIFATFIVNPFWSVLVTQISMNPGEVRMANLQFMRKAFFCWMAVIAVLMIASHATMLLPALPAAGLMIFLCAWLYVAAREIFGGISSNSYSSEVAPSPMEA